MPVRHQLSHRSDLHLVPSSLTNLTPLSSDPPSLPRHQHQHSVRKLTSSSQWPSAEATDHFGEANGGIQSSMVGH